MRPIGHLSSVGHDYPGFWRLYDDCLADRVALGGWPEWCHCPMAAAYAVVTQGGAARSPNIGDVARVAALAAWRPTQGVYRPHPALLSALRATPVTGELPVAHLLRLPEWCVYVETDAADPPLVAPDGARVLGFFGHLEHDANRGRPELRLLLDTATGLFPIVLHIGDGTLAQAVDGALAEAACNDRARGSMLAMDQGALDALTALAGPLVSVLLYLCAGDPELRPKRGTKRGQGRPTLRQGRNGPYMPAATRPEVWETGFALGEAIAAAGRADPSGGTVRGHIRRAHWHSFGIGSGESRRLDLRWLPPIAVNLDTATNVTIRHFDVSSRGGGESP